jgi:hypothetical protein
MKKNINLGILTILALGMIFAPGFSLAATVKNTTAQAAQTAAQAKIMATLKSRADEEVDRRIAELNKLTTKISSLKKLSGAQQSAFTAAVQQDISDLTSLKTKIDADTDLVTMRADVKSIVDDYRVFALFVPKIHLLAASEIISETTGQFDALATKLQAQITELQTAGNDTTVLTSDLSEMQAKITDAKKQASSVTSTVTSLDPSGYPDNKTILQSARTNIQTGRQDLAAARADSATIIDAIKTMKATTATNSSGTTIQNNSQ